MSRTARPVAIAYGTTELALRLPAHARVYASAFPSPGGIEAELVLAAAARPVAGPALSEVIAKRRPGEVVVVVSDTTRPVPYSKFLAQLLASIESAGVAREEILVLVATGMHRVSTPQEHVAMFGSEVVNRYRIKDHDAADEASLVTLPGASWSGAPMRLNAAFVNAGLRIVTGLVEPHFMAGFSGGRKAVCPGLADLATVRNFHGYSFLAHPAACSASLTDNPLHREALSVAQAVGVDFSLSVVLDSRRRMVAAFAGGLEQSHGVACSLVARCACPTVDQPAGLVITGCGGAPLDATFYQCVKGFVSCLPAVKRNGVVIAAGSCSEGIGGPEYTQTMARYAGRWQVFRDDIASGSVFVKDQWQFQMHCKALELVGEKGLHFVTDGLAADRLAALSVTGHAAISPRAEQTLQQLFDNLYQPGMTVAVLPEGPYCAPVAPKTT